jgi:hypothetical protein
MSGKRKKYCGIPTEQQLVADVDCCYKVVEELVDSVWDETYQPLGMHQSPHPTCLRPAQPSLYRLSAWCALQIFAFHYMIMAGFARPVPLLHPLKPRFQKRSGFCLLSSPFQKGSCHLPALHPPQTCYCYSVF